MDLIDVLKRNDVNKSKFLKYTLECMLGGVHGINVRDIIDSISENSVYLNKEILENNPFEILDQDGVGKLMKIAIELGRKTRPDLKLGLCGEHGGEPSTVKFCNSIGLDYVSCSPYRIPVAIIAAAQAAIEQNKE